MHDVLSISTTMGDTSAPADTADQVDQQVIVKDEHNCTSPTYHLHQVYADDVYTPATPLNAEHPQNGLYRQYDVTRQYRWMLNDTGDHATDCGA